MLRLLFCKAPGELHQRRDGVPGHGLAMSLNTEPVPFLPLSAENVESWNAHPSRALQRDLLTRLNGNLVQGGPELASHLSAVAQTPLQSLFMSVVTVAGQKVEMCLAKGPKSIPKSSFLTEYYNLFDLICTNRRCSTVHRR